MADDTKNKPHGQIVREIEIQNLGWPTRYASGPGMNESLTLAALSNTDY